VHEDGVLNRKNITGAWRLGKVGSPRRYPVPLTEDTGRGQSRWFRVGACCGAWPPFWVRPKPGIWGTRPERECNAGEDELAGR
jgi:hypothetical protein